jgi:CTP synthase (UTP-ammonia lyase)
MLRIAVVADYQPTRPSHVATDAALGHAGRGLGIDYSREWLPTERVATDSPHLLEPFDGFFIGPGSPYKSLCATRRALRISERAGHAVGAAMPPHRLRPTWQAADKEEEAV